MLADITPPAHETHNNTPCRVESSMHVTLGDEMMRAEAKMFLFRLSDDARGKERYQKKWRQNNGPPADHVSSAFTFSPPWFGIARTSRSSEERNAYYTSRLNFGREGATSLRMISAD